MPAQVQPSREKVRCGYQGCSFNGQKRLYSRHLKAVHKDGPPKLIAHPMLEKFKVKETDQDHGKLQSAPSVADTSEMSAVQQTESGASIAFSKGKSPVSNTEEESLVTTSKTRQPAADLEPAESYSGAAARSASVAEESGLAATEPAMEPTTINVGSETLSSHSSQVPLAAADKAPASLSPNIDVSCIVPLLNDIQDRLARVEQKQDVLLQKCGQNITEKDRSTEEKRAGDRSEDAIDVLYRACRGLKVLEEATGHCLISCPEYNALHCKVCIDKLDPEKHLASYDKPVTGVFTYDFSSGTDFTGKNVVQPTEFRNLKMKVKRHFTCQSHGQQVEEKARMAEITKGRFVAEKQVSKRVLRTGYYVLKKSHPHANFEDLVALQHRSGLGMGSINHSVSMMPKLRAHFSDVLRDMLKQHIASQPCVAVCADKVTVERRTMDIIALLTVVPGAPPNDILQSFVIGAPVVKGHSGKDLATDIATSLKALGITHHNKVASVCMDGQYHHLSVPEHLCAVMNSADTSISSDPCIVSLWDGSHLLNLADHDARGSAGSTWVTDTINKITQISKRHYIGKGLEEFLDAAADHGTSAVRPKLWSTTRFAPYAALTMEAFQRNAKTFQHVLEKRVEDGRADQSDHTDLRLLKGGNFLVQVAALCDIYSVLAEGSKALQDLQVLPWERKEKFDGMLRKLEEMEDALRILDITDAWPCLAGQSRGVEHLAPDLLAFLGSLYTSCVRRGRGVDARGNSKGAMNRQVAVSMCDIRNAGALKQLQRLPHQDCLQMVKRSADNLVAAKLAPKAALVELSSICAVWRFLREQDEGLTNQQLLALLAQEAAAQPAIWPFYSFVVRAWLMSPPESVVESMASVAKDVFGCHRQLKHENAALELEIRWNGPSVFCADDVLDACVTRHDYRFSRVKDVSVHVQSLVSRRLAQKCRRWSVFRNTTE